MGKSLSEFERLRLGQTRKLVLPQSHVDEYLKNGKDLQNTQDKNLRDDAGCDVVGYQFNWGQLIENNEEGILSWEIRFDKLHREFLQAGGNGEELAGMSFLVLENYRKMKEIPHYLFIDDSDLGSTSVGLYLKSPENEKAARRYLAYRFCNTLIHRIIKYLKKINTMADKSSKDRKSTRMVRL